MRKIVTVCVLLASCILEGEGYRDFAAVDLPEHYYECRDYCENTECGQWRDTESCHASCLILTAKESCGNEFVDYAICIGEEFCFEAGHDCCADCFLYFEAWTECVARGKQTVYENY